MITHEDNETQRDLATELAQIESEISRQREIREATTYRLERALRERDRL